MLWYGMEALDLSEDVAFEAASYDGANDKAIDFFHVDDDNQTVVIGQGKFNRNANYLPKDSDFFKLVHTTDWLNSPESLSRDGREDLAEAARSYLEAVGNGYSVEFHYVYMGQRNKAVLDAADLYEGGRSNQTPAMSARIIDLQALDQIHNEFINADTRISHASVTIEVSKSFETRGAYGKALTTTLKGLELQELYKNFGDSLFDRNVRMFLGTRSGSVNAGIRDTIHSSERGNFWAYNNGITIICDSYSLDAPTGNLDIRNFSIVNGCQTTVSVARGLRDNLTDVEVMARFIAAVNDDVVDSIIQYTNSQTPIRPWDISSQDSIQKRLKRELAEEPNPYFYELRRGEIINLTQDERRRFTRRGKFHVMRPDLLAQNLAAFRGLPVEAYRYKAGLFTSQRDAVFPSDLRIEEVLMAWLAGDAAEDQVKSAILQAQGDREDSDRIRVQILRRGGRIFTLSVMAIILHERNGHNFLQKLNKERSGSEANRQRLDKYAQLAVEWYVQSMKELMESGQELSVMIRNTDTFAKIKDKVRSKWRVQSIDESWVQNALPKI